MLDLEQETVITFSEAARLVPLGVHRGTIGRWAKCGVIGIHLESLIIAGRTVTTKEALERFLAACRERRWVGLASGERYERALVAKEQLNQLRPKRMPSAPAQQDDAERSPPEAMSTEDQV